MTRNFLAVTVREIKEFYISFFKYLNIILLEIWHFNYTYKKFMSYKES